ncbi:UbiA family prenyltransferase [Candidatus Woesearchaeota archaeon]|nr:UbiA family prenyltransferase [Candidatus Woesearchaeota archaeon]
MAISNYLSLLRLEQYYKNLIIFIALFFSGNLLNAPYLLPLSAGFIVLCLISSVNYILNDVLDRRRDILHAEKARRPVARGAVSVKSALLFAAILLFIAAFSAYAISAEFFLAAALLFLLTSLYSLLLKNEPFIDIILISANFVVRALGGALIMKVWVSPWLIIGTFFLALFLAVDKRRSEKAFLSKSAGKHRSVLDSYSDQVLSYLMNISTTALLIAYALYCFLGNNELLLITLPVVLYIMLKYAYSKPSLARTDPLDRLVKDWRLAMAIIFYLASSFLIIYLS